MTTKTKQESPSIVAAKVSGRHSVIVASITAICSLATGYLACMSGIGTAKSHDDAALLPDVPKAPETVATFTARRPITDLNYEWAIFNDNQWNGRSTVWYELASDSGSQDGFLRIHFETGNILGVDGDPYCGVYTDFSFPPYNGVDASGFRALSFKARCKTPTPSRSVKYICQLCTLGIPNYEYHEYPFLLPSNSTEFVTVTVPFADVHTPTWARGQYEFDRKRLFRVTFAIKGEKVAGQLDVDDIRFVK